MTFQETAKIMAVFRAAYSRYYANIDVEEARRVTTLWASMLADYSYETVSNAAKALNVLKQVSTDNSRGSRRNTAINQRTGTDGGRRLGAWCEKDS